MPWQRDVYTEGSLKISQIFTKLIRQSLLKGSSVSRNNVNIDCSRIYDSNLKVILENIFKQIIKNFSAKIIHVYFPTLNQLFINELQCVSIVNNFQYIFY